MTSETSFSAQIEEIKAAIGLLPDNDTEENIEKTAARLEGLNYAPSLITPIDRFLRMQRKDVEDEVNRILAMPEQEACALAAPGDSEKCQDLRLQCIKVLLFYYEKLIRLRQGDAEEWDEIDELYVHD